MKLIAALGAATSLALLAGCAAERAKPAITSDVVAQMNAELAHAIGTTRTTSAELETIELPSERMSLAQWDAEEEAAPPVRTWGSGDPGAKP